MADTSLETSAELRDTLANVDEAIRIIEKIDWSLEASVGEIATNGLFERLTVKEIVNLELARMGLSAKEAGTLLDTPAAAVQNHRHALREKMGVHSITGAVAVGIRLGIIPLALETTGQTEADSI